MASKARLLPSDQDWVDTVSERLLDGEILLVRGLPRAGKSLLCTAIAGTLGDSALLVRGSEFSERNQADRRDNLKSQLDQRLDSHGIAQLLLDDYGAAIRRSQGGALHSHLYGLLVDGQHSRDIGALLTSRFGDDLDLRFSGSPLLGRANVIGLPRLEEEDSRLLETGLDALRTAFGETTTLGRLLLTNPAGPLEDLASEFLSHNAPSIARDLPTQAIQVLLGAMQYGDADALSRRALLGLGRLDSGAYTIASTVKDSSLLSELRVRDPGWPDTREESVQRFLSMLAGADDAIWIDRYLFTDLVSLRSFLLAVRSKTPARIRLLGCDDRDVIDLAADIARRVESIPNVEARMMTRADRPKLHDRHLVLPDRATGFVLPTAGVITGTHETGSAVAVPIPALPIDYSGCWHRAHPAS